jgi:uncharacterized protein (DUF2062 family)
MSSFGGPQSGGLLVQRTDIFWVGTESTCMHMAHVAVEVVGVPFFLGLLLCNLFVGWFVGLTFLTLPPPHLQTILKKEYSAWGSLIFFL